MDGHSAAARRNQLRPSLCSFKPSTTVSLTELRGRVFGQVRLRGRTATAIATAYRVPDRPALSRASPRKDRPSTPSCAHGLSSTSRTRKRPVSGSDRTAPAGYGTGARLEYLLIPLVFGLGRPSLPSSRRTSGPRHSRREECRRLYVPAHSPSINNCERVRAAAPISLRGLA